MKLKLIGVSMALGLGCSDWTGAKSEYCRVHPEAQSCVDGGAVGGGGGETGGGVAGGGGGVGGGGVGGGATGGGATGGGGGATGGGTGGATGGGGGAMGGGTGGGVAVPAWFQAFGGSSVSQFEIVDVDFSPTGQVGIVGSFTGNADMGGQTLNTGARRPFFARYSSSGQLEYATGYGATLSTLMGASSSAALRFDSAGVAYALLNIDDKGITLPGSGTVQALPTYVGGVLAQLTPDGGTGWVKSFTTNGGFADLRLESLAISPVADTIVVMGYYNTRIDIDGGPSFLTNDVAGFYAGFHTDGGFLWASSFYCMYPRANTLRLGSFDVNGDLYFIGLQDTGANTNGCSDPKGGVTPTQANIGTPPMVVKAFADGGYAWTRIYPGLVGNAGALAVIDGTSSIWIANSFSGTYDAGVLGAFAATGTSSILLQKLDGSGTPIAATVLGGTGTARATRLQFAPDAGSLWLSGDFRGDGFGQGANRINSYDGGAGTSGDAVFIAQFDTNLSLLQLRSFTGAGSQNSGAFAMQGSRAAVAGQFMGALVWADAGVPTGPVWMPTRGFLGTFQQ